MPQRAKSHHGKLHVTYGGFSIISTKMKAKEERSHPEEPATVSKHAIHHTAAPTNLGHRQSVASGSSISAKHKSPILLN